MPLFFVVEEDEVFEIAFDVSTYETSKRLINQKTIKCFWNSDLNDIILTTYFGRPKKLQMPPTISNRPG